MTSGGCNLRALADFKQRTCLLWLLTVSSWESEVKCEPPHFGFFVKALKQFVFQQNKKSSSEQIMVKSFNCENDSLNCFSAGAKDLKANEIGYFVPSSTLCDKTAARP